MAINPIAASDAIAVVLLAIMIHEIMLAAKCSGSRGDMAGGCSKRGMHTKSSEEQPGREAYDVGNKAIGESFTSISHVSTSLQIDKKCLGAMCLFIL